MTVPKRFGVLRFFGTLLKVIAWIILILSILIAVGFVIAGGTILSSMAELGGDTQGVAALAGVGGGILFGLLSLIGGLVYFLILYVAGENIHLQLAVEENTRLTAALLLRMHQEGQADTSATAYGTGGGFTTDPYETN
jgi:hypothetical protein